MNRSRAITRRGFLGTAGAEAAVTIVPRHAIAQSGQTPPSERLNIAGIGVVGDWGCHVIDPVFWALDLGAPKTVVAQAKDYDMAGKGELG